MTGGLLVWAAHFSGLYAFSSLADVVSTADNPAWRLAGLAFSALCFLTSVILLGLALRRRRDRGRASFTDDLAALSAGVSLIAVAWQALPTVIGY